MPPKIVPLLFFMATVSLITLTGCPEGEFIPNFNVDQVQGFAPVYEDTTQLYVRREAARPLDNAGKIYSYGDLLVVNERQQGFHVFDNSDPAFPVNLFFIKVPGNQDVAVKNGIVYADNYSDLLALEITLDSVIVLKRLKHLIHASDEFPPTRNSYFECIDPAKGVVAGWQARTLTNPQCYRP